MPAWRRADLELHWWDELLGGFPRDVTERLDAITDLVAALPDTDPQLAEALCTAGIDASFARAQGDYLRAIDVLRRRSLSPDQAYGSLLEQMFAVELTWDFTAAGKARHHAVSAEILLYGDSCDIPDIANLERQEADAYQRIGPRPRGTPPQTLRRPKRATKLSPRLAHVVALREEVDAAVGADHPYAAAMAELVARRCDEERERARDPAACPTLEAAFQRGVEIRVAHLGEDHPATRDALLRLGALRLQAGKLADAEALLRRAAAGPPIDTTRITATLLVAGIEYARGETGQALDHARAAAEASATARHRANGPNDPWKLVGDLATAVGDSKLAERAAAELAHPRDFSIAPGFAQRLDEVGKVDHASAVLDLAVENARIDVDAGPPELVIAARARLRDALWWRAAFHRWHSDPARSEADLRTIAELDKANPPGQPMPP